MNLALAGIYIYIYIYIYIGEGSNEKGYENEKGEKDFEPSISQRSNGLDIKPEKIGQKKKKPEEHKRLLSSKLYSSKNLQNLRKTFEKPLISSAKSSSSIELRYAN